MTAHPTPPSSSRLQRLLVDRGGALFLATLLLCLWLAPPWFVAGDNAEFCADPTRTTIPGVLVEAVVHAPMGAWPGACPGVYDYDRSHLLEYNEIAKKNETASYLDRYVRAHADDASMIAALDGEQLSRLRMPR